MILYSKQRLLLLHGRSSILHYNLWLVLLVYSHRLKLKVGHSDQLHQLQGLPLVAGHLELGNLVADWLLVRACCSILRLLQLNNL